MNKYILIDYGINNLYSVQRMMQTLNVQVTITSDADQIRKADKIILPGVGAFSRAMTELKARNLDDALEDYVDSGKPLLGICLGMQLLFSESEEFGTHKGFNFVEGKVVKFKTPILNERYKIPQMNWNEIRPHKNAKWESSLLDNITPNSHFYFVHSYVCYPQQEQNYIAETRYGNDTFCSVVNKDNVWGCQFHPEKSAANGINIFKNFIEKI